MLVKRELGDGEFGLGIEDEVVAGPVRVTSKIMLNISFLEPNGLSSKNRPVAVIQSFTGMLQPAHDLEPGETPGRIVTKAGHVAITGVRRESQDIQPFHEHVARTLRPVASLVLNATGPHHIEQMEAPAQSV